MTERRFAGIREAWAKSRELHDNQIDWLISAIEERDAIIHDLMIDHQQYVDAGRAEGMNAALDIIREFRGQCLKDDSEPMAINAHENLLGRIQASNILIDAILILDGLSSGGKAELLPPQQIREEVDRLRRICKKIEEAYDRPNSDIHARADRMAKLASGAWSKKWEPAR